MANPTYVTLKDYAYTSLVDNPLEPIYLHPDGTIMCGNIRYKYTRGIRDFRRQFTYISEERDKQNLDLNISKLRIPDVYELIDRYRNAGSIPIDAAITIYGTDAQIVGIRDYMLKKFFASLARKHSLQRNKTIRSNDMPALRQLNDLEKRKNDLINEHRDKLFKR